MDERGRDHLRRLFTFMTISVDGFFEGRNHGITWHNVDEEFNKFAIEQLRETSENSDVQFGERPALLPVREVLEGSMMILRRE